jgi:hypothetical protein
VLVTQSSVEQVFSSRMAVGKCQMGDAVALDHVPEPVGIGVLGAPSQA